MRRISLLVFICLVLGCLAGCGPAGTADPSDSQAPSTDASTPSEDTQLGEFVDYAAELTLDMNSESKKVEVTVKGFVDGDTTHFYTNDPTFDGGVIKARYLAIDTPESTGKIEEYGKTASLFTRGKLENATSIIVESDDENWNTDSTGGRYLLWIWYKTADMTEYRNLNLEILQNGLCYASKTGQNRYGDICTKALNQAKAHKLNMYSGEKDPNFYYGGIQELTLKELRTNTEAYSNTMVAFTGVVTLNTGSNMVYVESYDEESELYYGMSVYYGFNLSGAGLEILNVGNEVRIVGSVQYYEAGGSWQVSDLSYRLMKPDDPSNIQKLSEGNSPAWVKLTADTFFGTVELEQDEGTKEYPYAQLALSTTVSMDNLHVKSIYTTTNEESSSKGAMTLTCTTEDGQTVTVRTAVLRDENGNVITEAAYLGKTISVQGVVDIYNGEYQIKVFTPQHITIHE
ncbi:MAG: thermonuclease family protein [Faecousia sp.]